jgi:hypothetical protein
MRTRLVLLVVAILLIAGFAALNWSEVVRPAPLLFGPVVMDAPLGAILLSLLAIAVIVFALSAGALRTTHLVESRRYAKELEAQRLLADKAETSRYTELHKMMDDHLQRLGERDMALSTEWQRELRAQMEGNNRMLTARLNELEHRLEARFERMGVAGNAATPLRKDDVPVGVARDPLRDQQVAEDARVAQMREQERVRDEGIREERELRREERAVASDKPETGWRRWF